MFSICRHFRAPVRLPENVVVDVVIVTKVEGRLQHRVIAEELTAQYDDLGLKQERDAFDTLFDHAPDKLQVRQDIRDLILIFDLKALPVLRSNPHPARLDPSEGLQIRVLFPQDAICLKASLSLNDL